MLAGLGCRYVPSSQAQGGGSTGRPGPSEGEGDVSVLTEGDVSVLVLGPWSVDRTLAPGPSPLTRLYCMNGGHHLRILPDGTVEGGRQENDVYDVLRVKAVSAGVVVIRGQETGRYLAMDQDGRVYSSPTFQDECPFQESLEENHFNTYRSLKYLENSWYLGLKRSGAPKNGPRTHLGQKAVCFLPRPVHGAAV